MARLLARNGCREYGVARWPLAGGRAGPTFEDEASPATRYCERCFGDSRWELWEEGSEAVAVVKKKSVAWSRGW